MSKKYLRLICNPNKWFGENNEENYKINELLKNLGSSSWSIGNLKNIYIGMKGIIQVGEDNRAKWLLDRYNITKLKAGIYAIIEVIEIYENRVKIKAIKNFFSYEKIINKEKSIEILGKDIFKAMRQGYLNESSFIKIENYYNLIDIQSVDSNSFNISISKPSTIDKISIKDYFFLENIEIENLKHNKEIYIVGENGDGKTLFLQALVLALRGNEDTVNHLIKSTATKMTLLVEDSKGKKYRYIKNKDNNYKNIIAYGVHRGKYKGKENTNGYLTLFDNEVALNNIETWLKELRIAELEKDEKSVSLSIVKKMLKNILDENIEDIKIVGKNVIFIERGAEVTINELSEGYKSVMIWVSDLLNQLTTFQPMAKDTKDFYGIVLVDEIDLHLHPKWAYNIVGKLRKWFPNIQFIFTTHSPIVILGASDDSIFFKIYKKNGISKISQPVNDIKNLMANSVTTSPLFSLPDARAKNNDNNIDTSDDFLYSKIHKKIAEDIKNDNSITEDDILKMVDEALEIFDKENNL